MTTTDKPAWTDGQGSLESDAVYQFMMKGIPYRYDAGVYPRFLTRAEAEAKADTDPVFKAEATKSTEDGPGGMIYQVLGPALAYITETHPQLDSKDEKDILEKKSPEGLWWHYDDTYYRITKAMKIPYVVKQNGKEYVKHIMVGYAGIDGAG